MPKIEFTETFEEYYGKLPMEIQKKVKKVIHLLVENPRHPSLRAEPIEGAPGIYKARVDRGYRLTYERLPGDVLRLRVVGKRDETLKNP
jgi:addiction module RelE/StbE family toxin